MKPFRWWPWILVALYMVMIFVLSSFSVLPQPPVRGIDKPEHYIEFGGLAALAAWAFRRTRPGWRLLASALAAVGLSVAYAATDELHHSFVLCRVCDPIDWVADVLGAVTGAALVAAAARLRRKP